MERRRPEVLALFEEHVFGKLPTGIGQLRVRQRSRRNGSVDGIAIRRELTVYFSEDDHGPAMDMLVYTPLNAPGPVPVFLGYNFHGNHTVEDDPNIHITKSWVRGYSKNAGNKAREEDRGKAASRWDLKTILNAGMGLATIYYGDVDPDFHDEFRNGIHSLVETSGEERAGDAGGSISTWAWGLSRALDVLETDSMVDGEQVAVFGHSRLGKTSLWAGRDGSSLCLGDL